MRNLIQTDNSTPGWTFHSVVTHQTDMSRLARDKTCPVPSVNSTRALLQNLYDTHLYFVIQSSSQLYSVYKKRLYSDTIYKIIFYPILLTCQMHTDYTVNSAHDLFI